MRPSESKQLFLAQACSKNAFLSELAPDEFAFLRPHLTPVTFSVGQYLQHVGDRLEDVIFPHSGLVAMTLPLRERLSVAAILVGRDSIIGSFAAIARAPAGADAEVYIAGQGVKVPMPIFRSVLQEYPSVRRRAARVDSVMLAQAQQTAVCNAAHAVETRICRCLLEVQDRHGDQDIPLTQSAIGQLLGVRRTTVTLVAGNLEAAGVIRCRRGYMQVMDEEQLRRHSCCCYEDLRRYAADLYAGSADEARQPLVASAAGS